MANRLVPFALLGLTGLVLAAGWQDYKSAFPGLPCSDGWAGCVVDGSPVDPGMVMDSQGRPQPADMRLGFFDLAPLPALNPHVSLSEYTGAEPAGKPAEVAAAEPAQAEPSEPAEPEPARSPATPTEPSQAEPTRAEPTRAEPTRAEPTRAEPSRSPATPTEPTRSPTPVEPTRTTPTTTSAPPADTRTAPSTTTTARTAEPVTPTPVAPTPVAAPTPAATPVAPAVANASDDSCDDLVSIEAPAMMGQLGVARRKCLESRMNSEPSQTMKNKVSRLLMSDAEARRDQADWERLIKNHLENIDRSDPNLCMKYAIHLSRGGEGKATGVIRWTDYALENKQQWSGTTYTKNVYSLLKLRAQASNKLWQSADQQFVNDRTDENSAKAEKYRGMTKNYALEWLQYATASAQDTKAPMALCVSAAGNKEFCEG